jgi:tRNA A37 threonylcarbamoyladenosine modification protein TsaB
MDRRVVPVSTLEAVAATATPNESGIAAWVDAQRGEVFAQLFKVPDPRDIAGIRHPISASPEKVLEAWQSELAPESVSFHGDGAVRYADRIRARLGASVHIASAAARLAPAIGRIAAQFPDRAVLPHAIVPIYVRKPDAELARDKRCHGD